MGPSTPEPVNARSFYQNRTKASNNLRATFTGLGAVWCLMGVIMCVLSYTGSATKIWGLMGGAFIFLGLLTAIGARKL